MILRQLKHNNNHHQHHHHHHHQDRSNRLLCRRSDFWLTKQPSDESVGSTTRTSTTEDIKKGAASSCLPTPLRRNYCASKPQQQLHDNTEVIDHLYHSTEERERREQPPLQEPGQEQPSLKEARLHQQQQQTFLWWTPPKKKSVRFIDDDPSASTKKNTTASCLHQTHIVHRIPREYRHILWYTASELHTLKMETLLLAQDEIQRAHRVATLYAASAGANTYKGEYGSSSRSRNGPFLYNCRTTTGTNSSTASTTTNASSIWSTTLANAYRGLETMDHHDHHAAIFACHRILLPTRVVGMERYVVLATLSHQQGVVPRQARMQELRKHVLAVQEQHRKQEQQTQQRQRKRRDSNETGTMQSLQSLSLYENKLRSISFALSRPARLYARHVALLQAYGGDDDDDADEYTNDIADEFEY